MLVLYETEDGRETIRLRVVNETVWLSQRQMAELFNVSQDNISLHLKNIYGDGELDEEATTEESSVVQIEGSREVSTPFQGLIGLAQPQTRGVASGCYIMPRWGCGLQPERLNHVSPGQRPGTMNHHTTEP